VIVVDRNLMNTLVNNVLGLLLTLGAIFNASGLCAQNKLPVGFELQSSGRILAVDSLVPEYYKSYSLGGQFRKGLIVAPEAYGALSRLLPIPILSGSGISRDQSFEMYKRAILFHANGIDPAGSDGNGTGKGNIDLPVWIRDYLKSPQGIDNLFEEQWKCGNIVVVDGQVFIPLKISNESTLPSDELGLYYNCLFGWAAAYPWFYYQLPNIALREALSRRDVSVVELFAQHRFSLTQTLYEELISTSTIPSLIK
jgi:hypothetical protein